MAYQIEPSNPYFEANRRIVEYEIQPAHTVTFVSQVDLTQVEAVRAAAGEQRPSYTAFVAKAVALALKEFPYANRRVCRLPWWPFGKRLQRFTTCDIAIAVERDLPGVEYCAFVDVLRDTDAKSLAEITHWLRELATCDASTNEQWRSFSTLIRRVPGWLSAWLIRLPLFVPSLWAKYRGGAVLISSPAKYGVDAVMASWMWPLGFSFGFVQAKPVVADGQLAIRRVFDLTLNFDRRVMAGAQGARFFNRVVTLLESGVS